MVTKGGTPERKAELTKLLDAVARLRSLAESAPLYETTEGGATRIRGFAPYPEARELLRPLIAGDLIFEYRVDSGDWLDEEEELPEEGERVEFILPRKVEWLPGFYKNFDEFVAQDRGLRRGQLPQDFYLFNENWRSGDDKNKLQGLAKLEGLCELIQGLREISSYALPEEADFPKLLFLPHRGHKYKTILTTRLDAALLAHDFRGFQNLLHDLAAGEKGVSHAQEKRMIMVDAICRFLEGKNDFGRLVKESVTVMNFYERDLSVYLAEFSFAKHARLINETRLDFVEKASQLVRSIAANALAVPGFFAIFALALRFISDDYSEFFWPLVAFATIGALCVALLIFYQKGALRQIQLAQQSVFEPLKERLEEEPFEGSNEETKSLLDKVDKSLKSELRRLGRYLNGYIGLMIVSCAPFLVMLWLLRG